MESFFEQFWLIPLFPLFAAGAISLFKSQRRRSAATLAITAISFSLAFALVLSLGFLNGVHAHAPSRTTIDFVWFQTGNTPETVSFLTDPLTLMMLLVVTMISLLVFIYSLGYMHEDPHFVRFFCFLSLFSASMLGLVISNHLLVLFMCWELVGLCSYLLIGF